MSKNFKNKLEEKVELRNKFSFSFFLFFGAETQTQGLVHARQALYQ
jgi:hypothetical protein